MATLGYARVSTDHQSLDQQHDALVAAEVDRVFTDKISGTRDDRPGLAALLDYAREGDTVVVVALDRLGRSLAGIVRTVETLRERGVMLRSLREGIDYSTPVGRMVAGIFASLAEYERELIYERAAAARRAARARGKQTGRPRALTQDQVRIAQRMREAGEPVSVICTALKVARSTLYRALGDAEQDTGELTTAC
ncbi:MAG TPA: recombinase family protein [Pseudonocardiaceae bacterium]|nr:recombinase family protein [Pseudonocardiaceae bacterium]